MKLDRKKENKWIIQKNISSKDFIEDYLESLNLQNNTIDKEELLINLKNNKGYKGRSLKGSVNTLGVRFSQICFYMLGYREKKKNRFIPSISTQKFKSNQTDIKTSSLINLFSMQYPSPYSKTPENFKIFIGRLIVKLLLDERIGSKLYIDEFIWFLPFIEKISELEYDNLIDEILKYRKLSYEEKYKLFKTVNNYDDVFSNCMHEIKYYFCKIYNEFGIFDMITDELHNQGQLLSFRHGNGNTFRKDNINGNKYSGYIKLNDDIMKNAKILSDKYSVFEKPKEAADFVNINDWQRLLYQYNMINYFADIEVHNETMKELSNICKSVVHESIYGGDDGKSFEKALKPAFELFRENLIVEIYSGAGNTDLLAEFEIEKEIIRVNIDAKKSKKKAMFNAYVINEHLIKHKSEYAIIVAPDFTPQAKRYAKDNKIVMLKSESLATYLSFECSSSKDGLANYENINNIILNNLGTDISEYVDEYIMEKYQINYA